MPWTLCFSTKVTSPNVFKSSDDFDPTTKQEAGEFVSLQEDNPFTFFLKLFVCIIPHVHILFSHLQSQTTNSDFVHKIKQQIKAASSVGRALAVHTPRGMLPSGLLHATPRRSRFWIIWWPAPAGINPHVVFRSNLTDLKVLSLKNVLNLIRLT